MPRELAIEVRDGGSDDAISIARLSGQLGYPVDGAEMVRRLEHATRDFGRHVYVAHCGDELAGWIEVQVRDTIESGPWAEIVGLIVADHRRGQGIGRRLVGKAIGWSRKRDLTRLRVRSNTQRADSVPFYLRLGFAPCKTQQVLDYTVACG